MQTMKRLERIFKGLGDPTRLRISNILLSQETCACELQRILKLSQPLLSRHLGYLRNAGLVQNRREGPRVFYSLMLQDEIGRTVKQLLISLSLQCETFTRDREQMRTLSLSDQNASAVLNITKG